MAERKLNFNAPLLSVRRFSSPVRGSEARGDVKAEDSKLDRRYSLPAQNTDSSLEQVTEPVAVPFNWEQIPGRRKDGGGHGVAEPRVREANYASPRFPIKWVPGIVKNHEDKKLKVHTPATVTTQLKSSSLDHKVTGATETTSKGANGNADNDDENEDDRYSDALESLSAADSCSMKCSVSGLSSSDWPVVKPSGTFSTDPQTRDFMMSRFLPAAKAMALEQPQYATKKQPAPAVEQPRQIVIKQVRRDKSPTVTRYESALVPYYPKDVEEPEEGEEECDEYDQESVNITSKACGFFPRLCFKNSVCLLNPVPGMKVKSLPSFSCSTGKPKKPSSKAPSRSSSPSSKKASKENSRELKQRSGTQSPRFSGSESFNYASDKQMTGRISPFSRRSGPLSPYRSAPQSPFRGTGPRGLSKEAEMFKSSKPYLYCKGGSKSQELTPVHLIKQGNNNHLKTLYMDTVNSAKASRPSSGKELVLVPKSREFGKLGRTESSLKAAAKLNSPLDQLCADSKALVCVSGNDSGTDPLPPLLPKTPSESWLWRTLPGVSSRSPFGRATSSQSKWIDSKTTSSKWETMVKSSNVHHDQVRYSEELKPYPSQHLKS
ncbi:unnamed protein product [Linum trigynum]|uniref:Uncharacterized protein n=1 Tax=Linum trigynum TaxID=586398 RepID=A0AAV2GIZ9_9ROSI